MALKKENRLRGKKEFETIKEKGNLVAGKLFSLLILKSSNKHSQFGFIVSKKIDQRAVVRNRIRRLLSEAVNKLLPQIPENLKIIVLAKHPLKESQLNSILQEFKTLIGENKENMRRK